VPKKGNTITYDGPDKRGLWTPGFGVRVTAAGARSFVLDYRTTGGRKHRYTIGSPPDWNVTAAREEAKDLRASVRKGGDPQGQKAAERRTATVNVLCDHFKEKHLPEARPNTAKEYRRMIEKHVRPALGTTKAAEVTFDDVKKLHKKITDAGAPYSANRCVAMLSKMFNLAVRWKWRHDNPAKGIARNAEAKRKRYLTPEESGRLRAALAQHERKGSDEKDAANILRLLLLTGARRGEVLAMRWDHLNLKVGKWVKPGSATKQKTEHEVSLSGPARIILSGIRAEADKDKKRADIEYVFPGRGGHRADVKRDWESVCKAAHIKGVRVHDLRHSFASALASKGVGLTTVGALLGHSNPTTTHRYAHLYDDHLRKAAEQAAEFVTGESTSGEAEVVQLRKRRRGQ
jgi:integrase